MSYINRSELDNSLGEIKQFCASYENNLNIIDEQVVEISSLYKTFEGYDGSFISGSGRDTLEEFPLWFIKTSLVDKVVVTSSSVEEYCESILREKEAMIENINSIRKLLDSMDQSLEVIAIYLSQVESVLADGTTVSFSDRLQEASQMMMEDAANGYDLLHSIPVLENGNIEFRVGGDGNDSVEYNGQYLSFYNEYGTNVYAPMARFDRTNYTPYTEAEIQNYSQYYSRYYVDIMRSQRRFTDFHIEAISNGMSTLILEDSLTRTTNDGVTFHGWENTVINMPMHYLLENSNDVDGWEYSVDVYTHETGHVLDHYLGGVYGTGRWFSESLDYQVYYNLLCENPNANTGDFLGEGALGVYAFSSIRENFAESVAEYYGSYGSGVLWHCSPNDLQDIEISVDHLFYSEDVTAYEIFDNILNNNIGYNVGMGALGGPALLW